MLILRWILAAAAVAVLASRPRSARAAAVLGVLAAGDLLAGAHAEPAVTTVAPLLAFLAAALTLAGLVERSGLARRVASLLAERAHGRTAVVYVLTCLLCVALTCAVSLDGAVVLMVPLALALGEDFGVPVRPLLLGIVVVANASSIAVPQGNPTNLVLIARLHLSPGAFTAHMLLPGVLAAAVCAGSVAWLERRALAGTYHPPRREQPPLTPAELLAAASLLTAALVAWAATLLGIAPWWPFAAVVALAVALPGARAPLVVPWRIAVQVAALVIVIGGLALGVPGLPGGPLVLLAVAAVLGAAAAVTNNLPASVWAGALLASPTGYAASIGLAIGPLATPQGSVATLIAADLAGDAAPALPLRRFVPIAAAALVCATLLSSAGL
jgi:Na+/H+ antiporter NhaD/arsenite permease-like protein